MLVSWVGYVFKFVGWFVYGWVGCVCGWMMILVHVFVWVCLAGVGLC